MEKRQERLECARLAKSNNKIVGLFDGLAQREAERLATEALRET
jgi:hypothetical protein